jgi:hypothetical protein
MLIPVRTVALVNVTLSGVQNINGATGADGDRVLLSAQTDPTENGVWLMQTGTWARPGDSEDGDDLAGMLILVVDGTEIDEIWRCENAVGSGVVGTDSLTLSAFLRGDPEGFFETTVLIWNVNGNIQAGEEQDGGRAPLGKGVVERVAIYLADIGGDGDTIVDIKGHQIVTPPLVEGETQYNLPGTSIYSTNPSNRPTLAGDAANKTHNGVHRAYPPDVVEFDAGSFFTMDIVQNTNAARDLTVLMMVRYN